MKLKPLAALAAVVLLAGCAGGGTGAETSTATGTGTTTAAAGVSGVAPGSEEDLAKNVGDRVFFAFDKAILSGDDQATLDRQAAWLQSHPTVNVQIAGNCDERGTEEFNIALGQRRANIARDYLVAKVRRAAASPPSATARSARSRTPSATTNRAGRRTATPSRRWSDFGRRRRRHQTQHRGGRAPYGPT